MPHRNCQWEPFHNQKDKAQLEVHSVERIYLRRRCFDASKPCITTATHAQYGFSRHKSKLKKTTYTFWLIFGLSPNLGLSDSLRERLIRNVNDSLPPTMQEVYVFVRTRAFVCLSVCVQDYSKTCAWIWMKCCVLTDVGTWTFEPDPDHSPDDRTGLLSPMVYALQRGILLCRENPY